MKRFFKLANSNFQISVTFRCVKNLQDPLNNYISEQKSIIERYYNYTHEEGDRI